NAHSCSRLAALTISPTPRVPFLSAGSPAPRSLCQSVSEPCGSASINRQGARLLASAPTWAVSMLFPLPPLREAKTMTFISCQPHLVKPWGAAIRQSRTACGETKIDAAPRHEPTSAKAQDSDTGGCPILLIRRRHQAGAVANHGVAGTLCSMAR